MEINTALLLYACLHNYTTQSINNIPVVYWYAQTIVQLIFEYFLYTAPYLKCTYPVAL